MIRGLGPQLDAVRQVIPDAQPSEVRALRLEAGAGLVSLAAGIAIARARRIEEAAAAAEGEGTLDEAMADVRDAWADGERAA